MLRIVKTENGYISGLPASDPRITAFKGIPFAKPPVGDLRWKAPQPAENWDGIRECYAFAPIGMQEIPGTDPDNLYSREWHVDSDIPMSEDCLYLNVWTNAKTGLEKMPVMIWIFGGGFQCGYTAEMEFDGERIARRDVILVSVAYRVGVLGFLSHPELLAENSNVPQGNYGLQDQLAAIEWVKRNIAAFGGDPDNITIFGQSAGAGSVISLLTSPYTVGKGLIHKAIFESGGGLRKYGQMSKSITLEEGLKNGVEFFEKNHISSLEDARKISAREIFDMGAAFGRMERWAPTIDGIFLLEDASDALAGNRYPDIPLLFGCTGGERDSGAHPDPQTLEELQIYAETRLGDSSKEFLRLCNVPSDAEVKKLVYSDDAFRGRFMNNILFLEQRIRTGHTGNYMYVFNPTIPGWDNPGAFHSSELWFVFETLAKCWRPFKGNHFDLARKICNYWTNFAKTGNPNGLDADGTQMEEWRSATADNKFIIYFHEDEITNCGNHVCSKLVQCRINKVFKDLASNGIMESI